MNQRYLLFNLHRGLYYYNKDNSLKAHGAKKCLFKKSNTIITCELAARKYHNGLPIEASDYVNSVHQIKELNEDSLISVKNIKQVKAIDKSTLEFTLQNADKEFLHNLANINLSPRRHSKTYKALNDPHMGFSGPYFVKKHSTSRVYLEKNKHYPSSKTLVSEVVALYIDDPSAALNLYNQNKINFLRYLDTSLIPAYKEKVLLSPIAKLDGIFLNPRKLEPGLRQDLLTSLDFLELKKIFNSKGTPGCVPLTQSFFNKKNKPCLKHLKKIENKYQNYKKSLAISIPSLSHKYHITMAEWMQKQWQKHLGLQVDIEQFEIGQFYDKANKGELAIYRKSLTLDKLTCKNSIETLKAQPEFKSTDFTNTLDCFGFFNEAIKTHKWIPLGVVHIPHLHASEFKGYYINELDQFGLEDLQRIKE